MKLRAAVLIALTTLSVGLVVFVPPVQPAWACSCAAGSQVDERAELIVVGTVTEVTDKAVRLAVESVEKGGGEPGAVLRLAVSRSEASCGYDFRTGTRYRVNAVDGATGLCVGVRPMSATPSGPVASPTLAPAVPVDSQAPAAQRPGQTDDRLWWLTGGAMLTVLAAGLVAVVLRRRSAG